MQAAQNRWYVLILGVIGFALLLRIQIKLYEERMIVDTAVSTFVICGTQFFDVTESRFAVGINQVLPVITSYVTTNIHWVVKALYANDFLWYLSFFLLFLFGFKKPTAALALVIGYFTFLGYNYLIITCSIPIAYPLLLTLMLILRKEILLHNPIARMLLVAVCLFFLAFSNPINTIATLLFFAYYFSETWPSRAALSKYIAAGLLFVFFVVVKNFNPDPYDMQRVAGVQYEALSSFDWPYVKYWTQIALTAFPISTPLLVFGAIYSVSLFKKGNYWKALMIMGTFVYLVGVFVMYGIFANHPYHDLAGKAMAPVAFLFSYIFAEWMLKSLWLKNKLAFTGIMIAIVLLMTVKHSFQVNQYSEVGRNKIMVYKQLIAQMPDKNMRYYINEDYLYSDPNMPIINPLEVVVYSAMNPTTPYTAQIVVTDSVGRHQLTWLEAQEIFHMPASFFTIADDNPFFNFTPNAEFIKYKPIVILTNTP